MRRRSLLLLASFLLASVSLTAQQPQPQQTPQPITYIAAYKVRPGRGGDFLNYARSNWQPIFERLRSDGTVLAWGVDTRYVHSSGEPQHSVWWTVPDYAALDRVEAALEALRQRLSAQQQPAATRRAGPATRTTPMQDFAEIVDTEQHSDYLVRSVVYNVRPIALGTPAYIAVNTQRVQPNRGTDWRRLWDQHTKPILDRLLAEGVILGYGLDVEEEHTMAPQWRWQWMILPNLAARDRVIAAFQADMQRRSESERNRIGEQFRETLVPDAHRDYLWRQLIIASR